MNILFFSKSYFLKLKFTVKWGPSVIAWERGTSVTAISRKPGGQSTFIGDQIFCLEILAKACPLVRGRLSAGVLLSAGTKAGLCFSVIRDREHRHTCTVHGCLVV